jgi:metal-dependent amidase/aminoacylase/carboxypeptidase family protein
MKGVAITTRSDVVKFAQTSSGRRQNVIPGARIVMIVTRKFSAVMIDEVPANWTPIVKNCCPSGASVDKGA